MPSMLRPYLQLLRLPNVFTALADIFLGFLFTHRTLEPWPVFLLLLVTSALLYSAGMVLNDVFDIEQDRRERPARPIPSGRISLAAAQRLGWALLSAGLIGGLVAAAATRAWLPALLVALLAACIVGYDRWLKRTAVGPVAMGACRSLNVLLGMSTAAIWTPSQFAVAGGLGVYVAGVTWFARREAVESRRSSLGLGCGVMAAGLGLLGSFPYWQAPEQPEITLVSPASTERFVLLIAILAILILRRCLIAVFEPAPARVQAAVKQAILSLVVLDAAVVLALRGPGWAAVVLALLAPALLLGRWLYST